MSDIMFCENCEKLSEELDCYKLSEITESYYTPIDVVSAFLTGNVYRNENDEE
jgi:hypothetical protein